MSEMSMAERFLQAQIRIQRDLCRQHKAVRARTVIEDPMTGWFVLMNIVNKRRFLRRYLRSRFGFDVRRWRPGLPSSVATWYDWECFFKAVFA